MRYHKNDIVTLKEDVSPCCQGDDVKIIAVHEKQQCYTIQMLDGPDIIIANVAENKIC